MPYEENNSDRITGGRRELTGSEKGKKGEVQTRTPNFFNLLIYSQIRFIRPIRLSGRDFWF